MLNTLKGELIKKGLNPIKAIMEALECSEKTARNKLNGLTDFTVPEAVIIENKYFGEDNFRIEYLFSRSNKSA